MTLKLAMTDQEQSIVSAIQCEHLPGDVTVHVFGSRAGGRVKAWSDLDLLLEGPAALPLSLIAALVEAFDESDLPWKVDLVDRKTISDGFGQLIDQTKIALPN